jgi:DNA modification methylase
VRARAGRDARALDAPGWGVVTAIVTRGDAGRLHLPDATVDLVVTSPPYFGLRSYQDGGEHYAEQIGAEATPAEYLDALMACTSEWIRVLKPGGSIFVNLGDKYVADNRGSGGDKKRGAAKWAPTGPAGYPGEGVMPRKSLMFLPQRYAIRCIDDLGLILRAEIVWAKPNGMPESVTDRVRRAHEQVFHFVKQPRYFADLDELREEPTGYQRAAAARTTPLGQRRRAMTDTCNPLGRLPGSVWSIPTAPLVVPDHLDVDHFAAYPPELVRRIVLGWSPLGGVVLDPFGGTGTTALVASVHGRVGISVDLSADYCRLAQWRTTDPGERARVLRVEKPPMQVEGQLGMFEGIGA